MRRPRRRSIAIAAAAGAALAVGGRVGRQSAADRLSARTERRRNLVGDPGPYVLSPAVADLHERLTIVDLHADSLLWGRDLLRRVDRGHVDVPRLADGNVALQVFAMATKVPRHMSYDRNDDGSDDVTLVALVQGWPRATWRSLLARAEHHAARLRAMAAESGGALSLLRTANDLDRFLERRRGDPTLVAGLLAIEGAHALDDEVANVDRLAAAGYRMVGLAHFFDNAFAGSAHGVVKGGLTAKGRELVGALERRQILVDLAHASEATIDDVLSTAVRPVVASHTGVRGVADNGRNLSDEQLRGIAATGGIVGIGFWETAAGGPTVDWIARSIAHAVAVIGADHVGIGSDFDGAVRTPFDTSGMGLLTAALVGQGLDEDQIAAVMGGSAIRLLRATLPSA
ncbi:MAG TPA: membrane dipeptidase [Candidatus Limnocylindrales bacterium]